MATAYRRSKLAWRTWSAPIPSPAAITPAATSTMPTPARPLVIQ
jgi:hypothetical protein